MDCLLWKINILFLLLVIHGCGNFERINADLDDNDELPSQEDLFDSISCVKLDDPNGEKLITNGRYCYAYSFENIYMLDVFSDYSIYVFDSSGRYIKRINNLGDNQEGKYKLAYDLLVDEAAGLLVVLDPTGKIIRYSISNDYSYYDEFLFSGTIPAAHHIGLVSKDVYALHSLSAESPLYVCSFANKTLNSLRIAVPIWLRLTPYMSSGSPFYSFNDQLYYFDSIDGDIFLVDDDHLKRKRQINFGPYRMSKKEIASEQMLTYYVNLLQKSSYRVAAPIYRIAEAENIFFASFLFRNQNTVLVYDKQTSAVKTFHRTEEGKMLALGQICNETMFVPMLRDQAAQYVDERILPDEDSCHYVILKYKLK